MRREVHVRFWEGLGVQSPGATRLGVCCQRDAPQALAHMQAILDRMGLRVNPDKTRCVSARTGFDVLGHRLRLRRSRKGTGFCYPWPTPQADASPRPADGPGGYRDAGAEPGDPGRGRLLSDQQREPDRPGAGPCPVHAAPSRASSAASPQGPLPHVLAGVLGTARRGFSDAPAPPRARATLHASDEEGRIAV